MLLEREVLMITIANPEKYVAGLYERLSNENIEVGNSEVIVTNEDEQESGSISTQKLFLRNFCKDNNIQVYDDYTDDGVSGATFDRPDFNRMIKDIENKKINLIIVKDLSRFGRLSSKISYYLEEFFIEKGVRFIAVTDDIDTGHIETSEEMVQFKAFFNEWFLRDTSRKVRNGKKTRAKEGKVMTTYPTYGYKKDPLDYNHYVIDQDIAPIVRRIFMLARNGMTPTEIGKILTDERTLVPSEIVGNGHTRKDGIKRGWNRNTVKRILQNVTYLGWVNDGCPVRSSYNTEKIVAKGYSNANVGECYGGGLFGVTINLSTISNLFTGPESEVSFWYIRTPGYDFMLDNVADIKSKISSLGSAFTTDDENRNDGYPILKWEKNIICEKEEN